jgi:hypothetical protein
MSRFVPIITPEIALAVPPCAVVKLFVKLVVNLFQPIDKRPGFVVSVVHMVKLFECMFEPVLRSYKASLNDLFYQGCAPFCTGIF